MRNYEGIPKLEGLGVPLLLIYGENDEMLSKEIRSFFTKIKGVENKIINNKRHMFLKTQVPKIKKIIQSFLNKLPIF